MSVHKNFEERLALLYEEEVRNPDAYQPVPFHYVEISAILIEK